VNADALFYACNVLRIERIRSGADSDSIEGELKKSYEQQSTGFMVINIFSASLSTEQFA
jgi:hypothetical protein